MNSTRDVSGPCMCGDPYCPSCGDGSTREGQQCADYLARQWLKEIIERERESPLAIHIDRLKRDLEAT